MPTHSLPSEPQRMSYMYKLHVDNFGTPLQIHILQTVQWGAYTWRIESLSAIKTSE